MKLLLMIMSLVEGVTGITLLIAPAAAISFLLQTPLDTPGGLFAGRIAGAALVAIAIGCWLARNGERGGAATGLVTAMLFYNEAAAFVLVYASIRLQLQGPLIWPAFVLHQGLAVWCLVNVKRTRRHLVNDAAEDAAAG